jgi:hypothetical protein
MGHWLENHHCAVWLTPQLTEDRCRAQQQSGEESIHEQYWVESLTYKGSRAPSMLKIGIRICHRQPARTRIACEGEAMALAIDSAAALLHDRERIRTDPLHKPILQPSQRPER